MNKTEREAVEGLIEWFNCMALDHIPNSVFQKEGRRLRDRVAALIESNETAPDIYLVVCENGFARGTFAKNMYSTPQLENCARLRNAMCSCGSQLHRIVRCVQQGTGRDIE